MASGGRGIQSIEVSGRIMNALVSTCDAMMLKDLALAAELPPAQCHAYLTSMKNVGLVVQDSRSGLYRLGPFAMSLGMSWLKSARAPSKAIEMTKTLTDDLGIMSLIAVWGLQGPTIVNIHEGLSKTALNLRQGTLYSVTGTATGRVFAAFGDRPEIKRKIDAELAGDGDTRSIGTDMSETEFDTLIASTRERGFASADGAPIPGISAVSAPVLGDGGSLELAITLLGPSSEVLTGKETRTVQRLLETAAQISKAVTSNDGKKK
jgi:DNA-binding IclR family transcriptional regulator